MTTAKTAHDVARSNSRRTNEKWCVIEKSAGIYDAVPEMKLSRFPYGDCRVFATYRSGRSVPTKRNPNSTATA